MKLYNFYFSPTGATKKVLDVICSAWECDKCYIDFSSHINNYSNIKFAPNDICIVAVPSFSGRVPQFIIPKLKTLKGCNVKTILVATYGNRAFDDTLIELKTILEKCDFLCVAAIAAVTRHSVMPMYGAGRPNDTDISELREYSLKCKHAISEITTSVNVPGNIPYRKYVSIPIYPTANKACIKCGLCATRCPVNAIPSENLRSINRQKCISCLQCTDVCPKHARHINKIVLRVAEIKMKKLCAEIKKNQLFL